MLSDPARLKRDLGFFRRFSSKNYRNDAGKQFWLSKKVIWFVWIADLLTTWLKVILFLFLFPVSRFL